MLDSEPLYQRAWRQAAKEMGFVLTDALHLQLIGRNERDSRGMLQAAFGSTFSVDKFSARLPRLVDELIAPTGIPRKPGLLNFLEVLGHFFHEKDHICHANTVCVSL